MRAIYVAMCIRHVALGMGPRSGRKAGHAGVLPAAPDDGATETCGFRGGPEGKAEARCAKDLWMNGKPEVVQKFISKRIVPAALQRKHIGDEDLKYRSTAHLNRSEMRGGGGGGGCAGLC